MKNLFRPQYAKWRVCENEKFQTNPAFSCTRHPRPRGSGNNSPQKYLPCVFCEQRKGQQHGLDQWTKKGPTTWIGPVNKERANNMDWTSEQRKGQQHGLDQWTKKGPTTWIGPANIMVWVHKQRGMTHVNPVLNKQRGMTHVNPVLNGFSGRLVL